MSFTEMLDAAAARYAARPAVITEERALTYGEMNAMARRLAGGLIGLGVSPGDRVMVTIGNSIEFYPIEFAIAKAGAVKVPTLTRVSVGELAKYIEFSGTSAVFAGGAGVESVRAALKEIAEPPPLIVCESDEISAEGDELSFASFLEGAEELKESVSVPPEADYAVRFTGGTTDKPKAVVLSHRAMSTMAANMVINWDLSSDDRVLHIHPVTHAAGFLGYGYWLKGGASVLFPDFGVSAERVLDWIQRFSITATFCVPTLIYSLLDYEGIDDVDTSKLRMIVYGSAPITPSRLQEAIARFGPVFSQIYGSSEASYSLTTLPPEDHVYEGTPPNHLRSVGRATIGAGELRIRDDDGNFLPPGEVGEIVSRGDVNMTGFWRNPELTASRVDEDGWIGTGDIGYLDEDGYLYLSDKRKEDMIISGGFNVWPLEVEDVIEKFEGVEGAAVFAVPDDHWGEKVCAKITAAGELDIDALREFLTNNLAKYKVPKEYYVDAEPILRFEDGTPIRAEYRELHA